MGIPCSPPCFEGVTPGETTAREAVEILSRSPVIATAEEDIDASDPTDGWVTWRWIGGGDGGEALFHTQIPNSPIYLIYPSFPTSFALADIIEAYGDPSHVIATPSYPSDVGGDVTYSFRILYRHMGFLLLGSGWRTKPALSEDTRFRSIAFFALTEAGLKAALGGAAAHPEWLVPWQGIQSFDFYCRDQESCSCP